ncbi:MAG: alpha/beta hydrolase, partial [Pseudomonadota bacterium]
AIDAACRERYGDLEARLGNLLDFLRVAPVTIEASNPFADERLKVAVNDYRLVWMIFSALYRWDLVEKLPHTIMRAERGGFDELEPLVELYLEWVLDETYRDAMSLSVDCHDRRPGITRKQYLAEVHRYPRVRRYVEHDWELDMCRFWPIGRAGAEAREPVGSTLPALFMAGEYDPVTPAGWTVEAARRFPRGHVFVFPGIGHGAIESDACASEVAAVFLADPSVAPEADCLSVLIAPDFIDSSEAE